MGGRHRARYVRRDIEHPCPLHVHHPPSTSMCSLNRRLEICLEAPWLINSLAIVIASTSALLTSLQVWVGGTESFNPLITRRFPSATSHHPVVIEGFSKHHLNSTNSEVTERIFFFLWTTKDINFTLNSLKLFQELRANSKYYNKRSDHLGNDKDLESCELGTMDRNQNAISYYKSQYHSALLSKGGDRALMWPSGEGPGGRVLW